MYRIKEGSNCYLGGQWAQEQQAVMVQVPRVVLKSDVNIKQSLLKRVINKNLLILGLLAGLKLVACFYFTLTHLL